ncbi:hypothetical protein Tco_0482215 [Tanacetum coccineum]
MSMTLFKQDLMLTRFLLRSFKKKREKLTFKQRAKFLHDTIAAQRRFLAQQRSEAIRNKLPTRNQLRNQMMTYLKYVGGYRHAQLNKKKFEEIQVMYEKVKRANENFITIGSAKDEKLIEKMNKKAAGMDKEEVSEEPESTKVKAKIEEPKENIRKRSGRRLKMKAPKRSKRQKTDSDHEEENQLRTFLKIVPEEEEKIDYEVLGTRYPIINWESKFYDYGHFGRELIYYRVFRADGSSRDLQRSYSNIRWKPLEFQVGDRVMLRVSPRKGVICFGKRGKLNPQYIGPFKILARIGPVAYKLELLEELSNVHSAFHVSNIKKCLSEENLVIPMKELRLDDKLNFMEELVEIMDREVKQLRQSRIPIVKVRWNSKKGPEFTWEREDQIRSKYPHLFSNITSVSD